MSIKSERIKKLENELKDLEHWLELGLVPKKDIQKHKEEIKLIKKKIEEEKERIKFLKESGQGEDFVPPLRRAVNRNMYAETPTEMEVNPRTSSETSITEGSFDMETDMMDIQSTTYFEGRETEGDEGDEEEESTEFLEDDVPFGDGNRWRKGILDPDDDNW